ncbi:transposase [Blastococcus capsensis]|uniref:transposase n=1 Tax=Blastococcus capsensis TaxID=1564163 RepID=UPI00253F9DB0|nr:transposase [Blastococcus capsensis]MDK3258695.1 transposase [Blastococcus capsensis]
MGRPSKLSPEFREQAVELVKATGKTVAEVARDLQMNDTRLGNWVKADRAHRKTAPVVDAVTMAVHRRGGRVPGVIHPKLLATWAIDWSSTQGYWFKSSRGSQIVPLTSNSAGQGSSTSAGWEGENPTRSRLPLLMLRSQSVSGNWACPRGREGGLLVGR